MALSVGICAGTCILMILSVFLFPTVKTKKIVFDTYWIITLLGAVLILLTRRIKFSQLWAALIANTAINPLKILILFISMTVLSVYLDIQGFFKWLAAKTLSHSGSSQKRLFLYLYLTVSILTVFTSNDVIILSFTPFICYFSKNAKIDPMPYLAAEFIAANTWSMMLIIGNPTNIYLSAAFNIGFAGYTAKMFLPTLAAGVTAFLLLYFLNRKKLSSPLCICECRVEIRDRVQLILGLIHLSVCTAALAVSSYIGLPMWLIALCAAISLFLCTAVLGIIRGRFSGTAVMALRQAPWQLVPFIISMFTLITALEYNDFTGMFCKFLGEGNITFKYGIASVLFANVINNIPMSVFFCSVISALPARLSRLAVFATVAGSNIGAFLTPVGALAGIMWSSILKSHGVNIGFKRFILMGITVAPAVLLVTLAVLAI